MIYIYLFYSIKDYCGDGIYNLRIFNVTDDDNAQYTCMAVNNGGRVESKSELYVVEKGSSF